MMHHRYKIATYIIALIVVCDQMTKWWIVNHSSITSGHPMVVTSFFNIVLVHNRGVTFGMLNNLNHAYVTYALIAVAAIILFLLGRWLWLTRSMTVAISLGCIMGGAIGNVIDRLRYGAVIDFLDFYIPNYHWPAFNIADTFIVTGVALLLLDNLVRAR